MSKIPLTNSAMKMYRRCPREYQYRYVKGIVANHQDTEALDFGSLVHDGLEAYLSDGNVPCALDKPLAKLASIDFDKAMDRRSRAEAMLKAYARKYPRNEDGYKVIDCEIEFAALPMTNPDTGKKSRTFNNAGKIDALFEKVVTTMLWLVEHKTASRVDENYFAKLSMDMQINRYSRVIQQQHGKPVEGVIYNVLGKCFLKRKEAEETHAFEERVWKARDAAGKKPYQRKKDETDEQLEAREEERRKKAEDKLRAEGPRQEESWEDFGHRLDQWYLDNPDAVQRREIILTKDSIQECQRIEWQTAKRIREDMASECFPKNPEACERYGRMCQYFPICSGPREAEAEIIKDQYRPEEINKELSNGNHPTPNGEDGGSVRPTQVDDLHSRTERSGEEYFYL